MPKKPVKPKPLPKQTMLFNPPVAKIRVINDKQLQDYIGSCGMRTVLD